MKTAETILREKLGAKWVNIDLTVLIDGMKEYAEQALDLAAEIVKDKYTKLPENNYQIPLVDVRCILKLKDQLK